MKIITVDVGNLLKGEPYCIRMVDLSTGENVIAKRIDIRGPSSVVFDASRTHGARVWVETEAAVVCDHRP